MNTLIDLFNTGMARTYNDIIPDVEGVVLNLGAGKKLIPGSIPIDLPLWNAETDEIPYDSNSVDMIHCYHFLEHISNVVFVIREIRRVLKPGAHVNIVVPYYNSSLQYQDLDHKHAFTENTFKTLFDSSYYIKGKVGSMVIATNFIMGDCEKNLSLIIQLVKPYDTSSSKD